MARPKSDLDPKRVNLEAKRKRRRKLRNRPEPLLSLKEGEADALAKVMALPLNPGLMLEPQGDGWAFSPPHNDQSLWELEVHAALATRSPSVVSVFLRDLQKLCGEDYDHDLQRWKSSETELNAALGMVADWQPENAAQAALAAQAVAVHWLMMRLSAQALNRGNMVMERDAALAGKLARTYAQLCEAMQALKGKKRTARQSISVTRDSHHHQHIHVHRDGGEEKDLGQPHEPRAATIEGCAALPSPIEGNGAVVPFPGGEGQGGLQQTRRKRGST